MEDECYDFDLDDCADYPFDSFGGHTKAIEGFEKYSIEGAEIFHMGQVSKEMYFRISYTEKKVFNFSILRLSCPDVCAGIVPGPLPHGPGRHGQEPHRQVQLDSRHLQQVSVT